MLNSTVSPIFLAASSPIKAPAELTDLLYLDKKDGIISGFDLVTNLEEKKVTVTRGIVKCGEKIFWMNEDYKFDMPEIENRYILKLNLFFLYIPLYISSLSHYFTQFFTCYFFHMFLNIIIIQ